jgi:hypothetical protein
MDNKTKDKIGLWVYIGTSVFSIWFFYWFAAVWR